MRKTVTGHMIVGNEDRFVWYAVTSVLPYVDKLIIFDTGSTDDTVKIIRSIKDPKIFFSEKGKVDSQQLVGLRNEQIKMTDTPWIWIIDGDEVYPQKTAVTIAEKIKDNHYLGIIVHRYDLLGDIYHCQNEDVGAYEQFGKWGHFVLRLINKDKIDGLQVIDSYPNEYYADKKGKSIKTYGKEKFSFINERIFHAMYLKRSSQENNLILNRKIKIEHGQIIHPKEIPEVFFQSRPKHVTSVTDRTNFIYDLSASFWTPLKKIKRRILNNI